MKAQIRRGDTLARMGGDEFTVILEDLRDAGAAAAVAQKIIDAMARAFVISGEEMFISTSIGTAIYPSCGIEPSQLTKNADTALYHAKACGRGCYRFYDSGMNKLAAERLKTVTQLRHAIARDEFVLHYQPQHDPVTQAVLGFEALLRWQHPERGLVYPGEFISILEDTGLIIAAGEWALRAACVQQKIWSDAGYAGVRMAVNVSARQFRQKEFINTVVTLLRDTGVDPHALQLELTESILVENVGAVAATLRALHTVGVRFAIDDFGTGYSSLSYLRQFPLDSLKIDRSFLKNLALNPGFQLPVIMRSPWTSSTRLCAKPPINAARTFMGSTPDLRASAMASATTDIVPPSTIWLHALQICPAPDSPTWTSFSGEPMASIAGRA